MVSPYEHLVQRLRRAREEAGVSHVEAAERLGLSQPLLSQVEACQPT